MGNSVSIECSKAHHRLSKPKTNTNSPLALLKREKQLVLTTTTAISVPDGTDTETVVLSPTCDTKRKSSFRERIQSSLFSPAEPESPAVIDIHDGHDGFAELATHVRDRLQTTLSRSASIISPLNSPLTPSTRLNSLQSGLRASPPPVEARTVDLETAMSLLNELKKNASPEDLAALHQALLPQASSPDASTFSEPYPHDWRFRPQPPTSTLIRRRSLATPGLATRGSPADILRRPDELWSSSPREREDTRWRLEMLGASPLARLEVLAQDDESRPTSRQRAQTPGDMDYSHLGALQLGSLVVTNGAVESPAPSVKSRRQIRRNSTPTPGPEEDYFTASEGRFSPLVISPQVNLLQSQLASKYHASRLGHGSLKPPREIRSNKLSHVPSPLKQEGFPRSQSAVSLAQDYMADLPTSPFENSEENAADIARLPTIHVPSAIYKTEKNHDENEDENKSYRAEAERLLSGTMFGQQDKASPVSVETFSTAHTSSQLDENEQQLKRPTHAKVDSGYSSGASLSAVPTRQDSASSTAPSKQSGEFTKTRDQALAPVTSTLRSRMSWRRLSSYMGSSTDLTKSPSIVVPSPSLDAKALSKQRKLQKQPPVAQQIMVQGCQPIDAGSVPNVPNTVLDAFAYRVSQSPGLEHMSQPHARWTLSNGAADVLLQQQEYDRGHRRTKSDHPTPHRHHAGPCITGTDNTASETTTTNAWMNRHSDYHPASRSYVHTQSLGNLSYDDATAPTAAAAAAAAAAVNTGFQQSPIVTPSRPPQGRPSLSRPNSMAEVQRAYDNRTVNRENGASYTRTPSRPPSFYERDSDNEEGLFLKTSGRSRMQTHPHPRSRPPSRLPSPGPQAYQSVYQPNIIPQDHGYQVPDRRSFDTRRERSYSGFETTSAYQTDWAQHSTYSHQRRKSMGEGLRRPHSTYYVNASTPPPNEPLPALPPLPPQYSGMTYTPVRQSNTPPIPTRQSFQQVDRTEHRHYSRPSYSQTTVTTDGVYDRARSFGSTVGARGAATLSSRKSMSCVKGFGVDLSDVPIFIRST